MRAPVLAAVLACATSHVMAQGSISIITIDRPSAATLALITINGNGFDAANAAISVIFSARDAVAVTVPAVTATANSVEVSVPPLVNTATGELFDTPVVADVQVVQVTRSNVATSNTLGGLTIEPTPAAPGSAGTFARAFLSTVLEVQSDMRLARRATAGFERAAVASQQFTDAHAPLLQTIDAIIKDADGRISLAARDALPLSIGAPTLRIADRLALAFVRQSNEAARATTARPRPAAEVPAQCNCADPLIGVDLCDMRRNPCIALDAANKVVPQLAVATYGAQYGILAAWAAGGLASAAVITNEAATALGLLWGQAFSYSSAVQAGVDPPGAWSIARDSATTILDELSGNGLGIFGGLNTGIALGQEIEKVVTEARGSIATAPQGGILLPAAVPDRPPANTRPALLYQAGTAGRWIATNIAPQVNSLMTATLPPPTVTRFNGNYTGTTTATCSSPSSDGTIYSTVTQPYTAAVADGALTLPGISASLSPTGSFTVVAGSCVIGGRFWKDERGAAGGTGGLACGVSPVTCAGTFNLTRVS